MAAVGWMGGDADVLLSLGQMLAVGETTATVRVWLAGGGVIVILNRLTPNSGVGGENLLRDLQCAISYSRGISNSRWPVFGIIQIEIL